MIVHVNDMKKPIFFYFPVKMTVDDKKYYERVIRVILKLCVYIPLKNVDTAGGIKVIGIINIMFSQYIYFCIFQCSWNGM